MSSITSKAKSQNYVNLREICNNAYQRLLNT